MTDQDAGEDPDDQGIDERALMKIAYSLPRYDAVEEIEALAIFGDMLAALQAYIAAYREAAAARARDEEPRPTVGTMRASLKRLDKALADVASAWATADRRTQRILCRALGQPPFDPDSEMVPYAKAAPHFLASDRGAYRVWEWQQGTARLAASAAAIGRKAKGAKQGRRRPAFVGFDELTERLAALFTRHTGLPLSNSRNQGSTKGFIARVIKTLSRQYRPSEDAIDWAIRRAIEARE
jgi:hypothetical protein